MTESRDTEDDRLEAIRMIRDSAASLIASTGGLQRVRSLRFGEPGFDPAVYRQMAESGWIGLLVPEEKGGLGLGMTEFAVICEEMGRGLAPEPLIPATLSASLLVESDRPELLQNVLTGKDFVVAAWQEAPDTLAVAGTTDGNRLFVPVVALSSDRALTSMNVPWIFRMSADAGVPDAVKRLVEAADQAGPNRGRIRDTLAAAH